MAEAKSQFLELMKDNDVIVVSGETGCGKTTQVCLFYKLLITLMILLFLCLKSSRTTCSSLNYCWFVYNSWHCQKDLVF